MMTAESFLDDICIASSEPRMLLGYAYLFILSILFQQSMGNEGPERNGKSALKKFNEYLKKTRNPGDNLIAFIRSMKQTRFEKESMKNTQLLK